MSTPVALVTGAAGRRSIGRAVALRLARDGHDVVVSDIERPSERIAPDERSTAWRGLRDVVAEVESLGQRAFALTCDLADPVAAAGLVERAMDAAGRLDVLVNTARAFTDPDQVEVADLTAATWDHVHAVNVRGPMLTCGAAARAMQASGVVAGRIVNVSSLASHRPLPGSAAYCSSKAALDMLTRVLALELGPVGIRVNAVNPGTVATNRVSLSEGRRAQEAGVDVTRYRAEALERVAAANPLRRVATPDDVANVVAFLAGPDSQHVHGQCLDVTGGPT